MFELTYDILDDLDVIGRDVKKCVIDDSEPKLEYVDSVDAWYDEVYRQGCTHMFTFEVPYREDNHLDISELADDLHNVAELTFGECPMVQVVNIEKTGFENMMGWTQPYIHIVPDNILREESKYCICHDRESIVFKIPVRVPLNYEDEYHKGARRTIIKMLNFMATLKSIAIKVERLPIHVYVGMYCYHLINNSCLPDLRQICNALYDFKYTKELWLIGESNWTISKSKETFYNLIGHIFLNETRIMAVVNWWISKYERLTGRKQYINDIVNNAKSKTSEWYPI